MEMYHKQGILKRLEGKHDGQLSFINQDYYKIIVMRPNDIDKYTDKTEALA